MYNLDIEVKSPKYKQCNYVIDMVKFRLSGYSYDEVMNALAQYHFGVKMGNNIYMSDVIYRTGLPGFFRNNDFIINDDEFGSLGYITYEYP